jgi:Zn-dependent protease
MDQQVVLVLFQVVVLILAFSIHECAHAWTANRLGDPTALMLGRVTLNPLKHLDLFGSVIFPLIGLYYGGMLFGWAKPTPVTPRNFKHYKRDDILVSLAGPASNLLSATVALILLLILKHATTGGAVAIATAVLLTQHVPVSTLNLPQLFPIALFLYYVILLNLLLFVFNLIPVPPLDGSHILRHFLPYSVLKVYDRIGMFGMLAVMLLFGSFIFRIFLGPLQGTFDNLLFQL